MNIKKYVKRSFSRSRTIPYSKVDGGKLISKYDFDSITVRCSAAAPLTPQSKYITTLILLVKLSRTKYIFVWINRLEINSIMVKI